MTDRHYLFLTCDAGRTLALSLKSGWGCAVLSFVSALPIFWLPCPPVSGLCPFSLWPWLVGACLTACADPPPLCSPWSRCLAPKLQIRAGQHRVLVPVFAALLMADWLSCVLTPVWHIVTIRPGPGGQWLACLPVCSHCHGPLCSGLSLNTWKTIWSAERGRHGSRQQPVPGCCGQDLSLERERDAGEGVTCSPVPCPDVWLMVIPDGSCPATHQPRRPAPPRAKCNFLICRVKWVTSGWEQKTRE